MRDKYKVILCLMLLLSVVNVLQTNRIENLEDKVARQKQEIVELQQEIHIINECLDSIIE